MFYRLNVKVEPHFLRVEAFVGNKFHSFGNFNLFIESFCLTIFHHNTKKFYVVKFSTRERYSFQFIFSRLLSTPSLNLLDPEP